MSFSINSDTAPECVNGSINNYKIKQVIHWDTLHPSDIDVYTECTKTELSKVHVPPGVKCSDPIVTIVAIMTISMIFILPLWVR